MKKIIVPLFIALLLIGLTAPAVSAIPLPTQSSMFQSMSQTPSMTGLSGNTASPASSSAFSPMLGMGMSPSTGTSLMSSQPLASSTSTLSSPGTTQASSSTPFTSGDWALRNMQFFQPKKAQAQPVGGLPQDDMGAILQMLSQLPTADQMAQPTSGYNANPGVSNASNSTAQVPQDTFTTNVTGSVPSDSIIFVELSKTSMYLDPNQAGLKVPNVSMNYKFDENNKQLALKDKKAGDINTSSVVMGYIEENDATGAYLFDYDMGSGSSMNLKGIPIVFTGADGRIRITFNGTQTDLFPGQTAEINYIEGEQRHRLSIKNFGLIPRSSVKVSEKI